MEVNPPNSAAPVTTAIWGRLLPRQPKQMRCRRFLAHSDEHRTFYWVMESTGPICQQCVNVRNTKVALEEQEASKSGNRDKLGKSGSDALAKRALGENYSQIARETRSSRNTGARNASCESPQLARSPFPLEDSTLLAFRGHLGVL